MECAYGGWYDSCMIPRWSKSCIHPTIASQCKQVSYQSIHATVMPHHTMHMPCQTLAWSVHRCTLPAALWQADCIGWRGAFLGGGAVGPWRLGGGEFNPPNFHKAFSIRKIPGQLQPRMPLFRTQLAQDRSKHPTPMYPMSF